ncbi:unnamed protein product [Prunus armeniaca]|uniref:Major facilitator superfamily (MFS) profile domain-containing protein n=1 Tax=Prunus armeniaca TaxID=36596 RepID=A0A6J5XTT3_PRUAR|nr:unnamed protein product [Prunus armeniaca]
MSAWRNQNNNNNNNNHHQPPAKPTQSSNPFNPQMTTSPISVSAPNPSWFSPKRLLVMLCTINMINYVDRGAIASNGVNGSIGICDDSGICSAGSGIQGDFKLSNFQDGVLSSAFMVGLLMASPIFASLAKSHNPFRLIGVGLSVWTLHSWLVGVGEASFISLAAPFIDDHAPAPQHGRYLSVMIFALAQCLGGRQYSWRYAFWGEAFCMLPFAVLAFAMNPLQLKGFAPAESRKFLEPNETTSPLIEGSDVSNINSCVIVSSDKASRSSPASKSLNQLSRFSKDMKELLRDKVYVVNILGYVSYNFVIGAYSYWGPKAGYSIYRMSNPDLLFGGITIVCGILGTLAGGLILDSVNATINNAFKLLSGATILGAIFCFSAFCVRSLYFFVVLFSMGELLVFATQAPVNYVSLRCVKPSLRPLSMAVSTVSIHIFGDVPSSPLAGILQDHVNNWRVTTLVVTSVLFFASGIWFIGIFISNSDKFNEDGKEEVSTVDRATKKPLFEENTVEGAQDSGEA